MSHRNTSSEQHQQQKTSSYVLPHTPRDGTKLRQIFSKNIQFKSCYAHNAASLSYLIPALASVLWWHDSIIIIQIFLFVVLMLYVLDLINSRDGVAMGVWISALVMCIGSGYATLLHVDDYDASGGTMILFLLQLVVEGMMFCSWACWITLQFEWLYIELPSLAAGMEKTLHSLLPPVCSTIITNHLIRLLTDYWGIDRVATLSPLFFAVFMTIGMIIIGCRLSSFETKKQSIKSLDYAITSYSAKIHTMVLLLLPGTMHVLMFRSRIFSRYASFDEIFDLALIWTTPYLLHCTVLSVVEESPYSLPKIISPKSNTSSLRGTFVPLVATLVASIAAQQRYLIPLCNTVAYQFNGHNLAATWVVSLYLTFATIIFLFAMWIWGKTSTVTNELFFGEYHEDIVQLSISASGMLLGKAFGFPWNLTPLPILAFLGLSVWITTKMMRYLCIFLFVVHAAGVVVFGYRFASINGLKIPLAIHGIEVSLVRFGMAEVFCSVLIGIVVGFVARPAGGLGASLLKRLDVPGIVLVIYSLLLTTLELTLIRRRIPENVPKRNVDSDVEDSNFIYDHASALITCCLVIGISIFTRRCKMISRLAFIGTVAISIGKGISVFIDVSESDSKIRSEESEERLAQRLLYRSLITSALIFIIFVPSALLKPIHMKRSSSYKTLSSIPSFAYRNIGIYSLLLLPLTLVASVPSVLGPLVMALSTHYNLGAYYNMALPLSEIVGCALSLWGIATLYMLNHYLPDSGGETWKKVSALTLLMGLGIAFSAPSVPQWLIGEKNSGISSPYAAISSLGTSLATQGRSRTGGWGILSASLATLLAITGPFELRERRHPSGRKDKTLFLRLMMFSIMFGSGISWFITIVSMNQVDSLTLAITILSCMVLSFFGTVTCVIGYFVELENLDEAVEMAKISFGAFVMFLIVTCIPSLIVSSASKNLFGQGGCVSTYLIVASCATLCLALVLRNRVSKNQASRSIGNLSCVSCYVLAVINILGRLGVAGFDRELGVTSFMGIPTSLFGITCISPILLILEGGGSAESRNRISRVSGMAKKPTKVLGITIKNLNKTNLFVPSIAGTLIVFYLVGLYSIFVRGSPFIGFSVPKSHKETISGILGKDPLELLLESATVHSRAYVISSKLVGCSFWTSNTILGPILHVVGLVVTIPSIYFLLSQIWLGVKRSRANILLALPLNIFPIHFCRGTPTIQAVAVISLLGGIFQLSAFRKNEHRSHMRI